jgi:hypothetical protein
VTMSAKKNGLAGRDLEAIVVDEAVAHRSEGRDVIASDASILGPRPRNARMAGPWLLARARRPHPCSVAGHCALRDGWHKHDLRAPPRTRRNWGAMRGREP